MLAAALLPLLVAACASPQLSPPQPTARPPLQLTILHTNDHHGRFWPNADGEYGLAARKTVIDRIRAEVAAAGGHSLLLDGGDVNTGVPESDLLDAEPDFKGMALLGYDAMAVGNHDFDKPPAVLARQRQWAGFPLLSANIYQDGQRVFEPYRIFTRGGYRIAVLGLTFKPNTDDMRDAPSIAVVTALMDGGATIRAYDPEGMEQAKAVLPAGVSYCAAAYECVAGADAAVIVTEWNIFRALDLDRVKAAMAAPVRPDPMRVWPDRTGRCSRAARSTGR